MSQEVVLATLRQLGGRATTGEIRHALEGAGHASIAPNCVAKLRQLAKFGRVRRYDDDWVVLEAEGSA